MKSRIETTDCIILDTGFVFLDQLDTRVSIAVSDGTHEYGFLCFEFIDRGEGVSLDASMNEGIPLFKCFNFNSKFGNGTVEPIEIGFYKEKKLFLHFWAYRLGKKVQKLEYTIFREK